MDFYKIREESSKDGSLKVYPGFKVLRSKDLMVRAKSFYAIWDEEAGLWSTDEYDVQRLVDADLLRYAEERKKTFQGHVKTHLLGNFDSNSWKEFRRYLAHLSDSSHQLDERVVFSNTEVAKKDYVSRRLPYPLEAGECPAYEEIASTLYDPDERAKFEWAIGAIIAGDAKKIQKFIVFYGKAGAGKSTIINIILKLFEGYYTTFEAKALTSSNNAFATESFKNNPLVAVQQDGDLSRIEDNTKLNSIISHEEITINEKNKPTYMSRINAFLFMGTNKPVKITDAKSGIIRRLIDVRPSGRLIETRRYHVLTQQVGFELGAIAAHCLEVYRSMGKDYYSAYQPLEMMLQTDVFYNYVEAHYDVFKEQNGVSLAQAYEMYKTFCTDTLVDFKLPRYKFREELKNYFGCFSDREMVDGERVRSWYSGFLTEKFSSMVKLPDEPYSLTLDESVSLLDEMLAKQPAQYSKWSNRTNGEIPVKHWAEVTTTLSEIDTSNVHYVKLPENHIVIDFDLRNEDGEKSAEKNIAAASAWPATYAELSQGGAGVHLHYLYEGDVHQLSRLFSEGIEVKVFTGDASLRRRLSKCNNIPVATIASGLPLREKKKVLNFDMVQSEKSIRDLIMRNLRKEIHSGTKPSVDFIHKILEDAYASGTNYDVTDLRGKIIAFANNSTNHAAYCLRLVMQMKFASENTAGDEKPSYYEDERIVFFDTETFPNLFMICWKYEGESDVVTMINPKPVEIEKLLKMRLVGFYCRRYDNHMLYAAYMGYNNEQLYRLSQKLISGERSALFGEAYDISYTDVYDFSSKKASLKRFQLDMGIYHLELGLPWNEPVAPELWGKVAEYCTNDVVSLEAVFNDRREDFMARQILADLSGLSVNHTTQQHTAKIIFGSDKRPQDKFVYTDLSKDFPGYKYDYGKSTYMGEETGEGGYVYAEPGMYSNVTVLDVASMHPTSIEQLNLFGPYTKNFSELKAARIAIKHENFDAAKKMLGGVMAKHLDDPEKAKALSYALKIVINIVYGLTSAKFDNPFRDNRNVDNIVAKRGALFMVQLKHLVQDMGLKVVHIKTDSIKIPDATPEAVEQIVAFGKRWGYDFELEAFYDKFCLVNDAVYIAKENGKWTATGAQFAHPYVFKTLFSKEPVVFEDLCETKTVTTALYLDFDGVGTPMSEDSGPQFVGRAGAFCPIYEGCGGGILLREKDGKLHAAGGTKGYKWLEAVMVKQLGKEKDIDMGYFNKLVDDAVDSVSKFGDFEWFVSEE